MVSSGPSAGRALASQSKVMQRKRALAQKEKALAETRPSDAELQQYQEPEPPLQIGQPETLGRSMVQFFVAGVGVCIGFALVGMVFGEAADGELAGDVASIVVPADVEEFRDEASL